MKPKLSKQDLINFQLTHRHGGNGWVMIEDIDKEYCRVIDCFACPETARGFLAWKPTLSIEMTVATKDKPSIPRPIPEERRAAIDDWRAKIISGKVVYNDTTKLPKQQKAA